MNLTPLDLTVFTRAWKVIYIKLIFSTNTARATVLALLLSSAKGSQDLFNILEI